MCFSKYERVAGVDRTRIEAVYFVSLCVNWLYNMWGRGCACWRGRFACEFSWCLCVRAWKRPRTSWNKPFGWRETTQCIILIEKSARRGVDDDRLVFPKHRDLVLIPDTISAVRTQVCRSSALYSVPRRDQAFRIAACQFRGRWQWSRRLQAARCLSNPACMFRTWLRGLMEKCARGTAV